MKVTSLSQLKNQALVHNPKIKKRIMISSGMLDHMTHFSRAVFPAGERVDAHRHKDMAEVFFVQSGSGEIRIEGESFQLRPGVCVVVSPGEVHELKNESERELVLLYFGVESNPSK